MHRWNCGYHHGVKALVLGVLILINIYLLRWTWGLFFAVLFIVWGAVALLMHKSCTCGPEMMQEMPKKRKR